MFIYSILSTFPAWVQDSPIPHLSDLSINTNFDRGHNKEPPLLRLMELY